MSGGVRLVSRVHVPASPAVKPVPETVTVVPGSDPMGGEPDSGLTVICAITVMAALAAEGSP